MRQRHWIFALAGVVAALLPAASNASARAAAPPRLEAPTYASFIGHAASFDTAGIPEAGLRSIAATAWRGRRFTTMADESVTVLVSPAYASDPGTAQRWADYFVSLIHGPELGLLKAYVAPLDEVQEICHARALGCYWANRLVMVGDSSGGIPPSSIAAHEYGHHVAFNRDNSPWPAVKWGTKRWASYMRICSRTAAGTAVPGDENEDYILNPGEAFAETYRVLNETEAGLPLTWPIVDRSFIPDATALEAVREDTLRPWTPPASQTIRIRFAPGQRSWKRLVRTPLDGDLSASLATGTADLQLLGALGRGLVARGEWTSGGGKALGTRICGGRSFVLRVARNGGARSFTLRVTVP
jgi:hypothetical protein